MSEKLLNDDESVEFTLEDAREHLKDLVDEMTQEMENLMHRCSNNEVATIPRGIVKHDVAVRYHKLVRGLAESFSRTEPKDLPIPNTIDLREATIRDIKNSFRQIQELEKVLQANVDATKKNIDYLESTKEGLEKMKGACSDAVGNVGNETKREELASSKKLFQIIKKDLFSVVDQMFPNEDGSKDVLAALTSASSQGGDDVYIDVQPESFEFAKFLVEADVASYHRNDKTKIRMTELL